MNNKTLLKGIKNKAYDLFNRLWVQCSLALSTLMTGELILPYTAFALGWSPQDMAQSAGANTGMSVKAVTQDTLAQWVTSITTWILGVMIVIFVLKLVLTAVAKATDGKDPRPGGGGPGGGGGGRGGGNHDLSDTLQDIPVIGAYNPDETWKVILINYFAKNVGIIIGAWIIIQLIVNILLWIFGAVVPSS